MGLYHVWSTGDTWVFRRAAQVSQCGSLPKGVSHRRGTFLCRITPADFTAGISAGLQKHVHLTLCTAGSHTLGFGFWDVPVWFCCCCCCVFTTLAVYKDGRKYLDVTYWPFWSLEIGATVSGVLSFRSVLNPEGSIFGCVRNDWTVSVKLVHPPGMPTTGDYKFFLKSTKYGHESLFA